MPNHRNVYISLATSMSKTGKFQLTPLVALKPSTSLRLRNSTKRDPSQSPIPFYQRILENNALTYLPCNRSLGRTPKELSIKLPGLE